MYGRLDNNLKLTPALGHLTGRLVVVVGGTVGLGRALAREAAHRGAEVIVVGNEFQDHGIPRIKFVQADLSVVAENARLGSDLPACAAVTIFVNSVEPSSLRRETSEGIELQMALSAISPHVILKGLAPRAGSRGRFVLLDYVGSGNPGVLGDLNCDDHFTPGMGQTRMNVAAAGEALVHHWSSAAGGSAHIFGLNPGQIEHDTQKISVGGIFKGATFDRTQRNSLVTSAEDFAESILPLLVSPHLDHPEVVVPLPADDHRADGESRGGGDAVGMKRTWEDVDEDASSSSSSVVQQRQRVLAPFLNAAGAPILPTPQFMDPRYVARWVSELDALALKAGENRAKVEELRALQQEQDHMHQLDLLFDETTDCTSECGDGGPEASDIRGIGNGGHYDAPWLAGEHDENHREVGISNIMTFAAV